MNEETDETSTDDWTDLLILNIDDGEWMNVQPDCCPELCNDFCAASDEQLRQGSW